MSKQDVRILLVEDNPGDARLIGEALSESTKIRAKLSRVDSIKALKEAYSTDKFDIIILDLSLPDASGLETVRKTHELAPATAIVVLTGHIDSELAFKAVQEGAQDYLIKGNVDFRVLERVILYALERNQTRLRIGSLSKQLEMALVELDYELEVSRTILHKIVHSDIPENLQDRIGLYYSFGSHKIGGDLYYIKSIGDDHFFVVADGTGHSVHAAILSIMFKLSLKHQFSHYRHPKDFIQSINEELQPFFLENMFCTAFCAMYSEKEGKLYFSCAGHPAQYVLKKDSNELIHMKNGGIPVGITLDHEYEEDMVEVAKGDKLILFTDGIYECFNNCGEKFGEETMSKLLMENKHLSSQELKDLLVQEIELFSQKACSNGFSHKDDAILIVFEL
ncbi:MAG: SpoIIE family protein phosphatase [Spirochaetales bacterium]|nr:SpoIIE family protein phosphatase [Spirochaetales bacterium]